jgi:hypothetical protein
MNKNEINMYVWYSRELDERPAYEKKGNSQLNSMICIKNALGVLIVFGTIKIESKQKKFEIAYFKYLKLYSKPE